MAKKILKGGARKSKKGQPRAKLTTHEIALLVELIELYGMRGVAQRFARL